MRRTAAVLVTMVLVAGCTGGGDPEIDPQSTDIVLDENNGSVTGRVLDEEFRAVPNATVAIQSAALVTTTDLEGMFELGPLPAGGYDVAAYALGYGALARRVEVVAGESVDITFTLPLLSSQSAFYETFPYVGFEACQWYFEGTIAHCTLPYTQVHGSANRSGVNLANYGLPRDLQDNRDRYNFTVRAEHTAIVSELVWQATSAAAVAQALILACGWYDPLWDECVPPGETHTGIRYHMEVGQNPIRLLWTLDEEQQEYLKKSPYIMSRANVHGTDAVAAGFALDQRVEMFNTVFYGADPPEGFTAGPPDQ